MLPRRERETDLAKKIKKILLDCNLVPHGKCFDEKSKQSEKREEPKHTRELIIAFSEF